MYVLGINGSPRPGGNTDILLDNVLEAAREKGAKAEKVILNNLKFSPCQECETVRDDGSCKVEDGLQPLYQKIKEADAIVLASPIFFGSLSAQTKMMVDRFQCAWRAKYVLNREVFPKKKKGAFVCVEASTRDSFLNNAKSIVKNLFATINVGYDEELLCKGIDEKAKILEHPELLKKARQLGEHIT